MTIRKIKPAVKRKRPSCNQIFQKRLLAAMSRIEIGLNNIQANQKHAYRHPK